MIQPHINKQNKTKNLWKGEIGGIKPAGRQMCRSSAFLLTILKDQPYAYGTDFLWTTLVKGFFLKSLSIYF